MRNWNNIISRKCTHQQPFSDYLWGIETQYYQANQRDQTVFRLPMRNWNRAPTISDINPSSFQTTYEELKLLHLRGVLPGAPFSDYLWGIETRQVIICTLSVIEFSDYLWGIETHMTIPHLEYSILFSDYLWGIETGQDPVSSFSFWTFSDYLWGIETHLSLLKWLIGKEFSDYLWGIETQNMQHITKF